MPPRKSTVTTPSSSRSHKRALSTNAVASTPSTRASKRLKESVDHIPTNGKATPKKSKYFDGPANEEETEDSVEDADGSELESGYEDQDEDQTATEASESESVSEDYDSEEDRKPKRKSAKKSNGSNGRNKNNEAQSIGEDLWREGVKTGLGPGKEVFIPKPKARGDGGIKYKPERIHPNTMAFLSDLELHNDRDWFKQHDPDYRQSWKDWESFVEHLTEKIAEIDETVPELPPKDLVFRVYRDVRFSKDPTPYKPHFSAAWSRTGRKGPYAGYYVQIKPGDRSFVGGGIWHPEAQPLALLRRNIDRRPERIRSVLTNDLIRKHLMGSIPKDEKKVIKKFCQQNAENALKTKPKGYEADHVNIDLLRLRNFTLGRSFSDNDILGEGGFNKIVELIKILCPFVTYLNSVVMPDDDDDDEDEDENDNGNDNDDDNSSNGVQDDD